MEPNATRAQARERRVFAPAAATNNFFSIFLFPCLQLLTPQPTPKLLTQGATPKYRRSLAGPSTVRGADASVESVWGRRSRPNEPQRKSDTDTRVDPTTSPVPRLEGNPTFVPKGSSKEEPFGRWPLERTYFEPRSPVGPILAQASPARASGQSRPRAGLAPRQGKRIAILHRRISERRS